MIFAIILFTVTYILMLIFGKYRPYVAIISGFVFIVTGMLPLGNILGALDFNVLLMIGGTMGLVQLFIESKMPARLADVILKKVPNVQWATVCLCLFSGLISAFVDNVATVLMVAPSPWQSAKSENSTPYPYLFPLPSPRIYKARQPW